MRERDVPGDRAHPARLPGATDRGRAPFPVFTELLEHRYVRSLRACVEAGATVEFRPWVDERWRIVRYRSSAAFHVQWIDPLLVGRSRLGSLRGAVRLLAFAVLLRAFRVRLVWTVHNPVAKAHQRASLDRALRSALVLCCDAIVVLGREVVAAAAAELPRPLRARFRERAHVVPIPIIDFGHDPGLTKEEARRRLGIPVDLATPLVAYLPGANQLDLTAQVGDPHRRYDLLTIDRSAVPTGLRRDGGRWTYQGRPNDETFGAIITACDAVLLSHDRAFGSLTAHAAALLERPVLSPACPAIAGLERLRCATTVDVPLSPASVWSALRRIGDGDAGRWDKYREAHRDEVVRAAALRAYGRSSSGR